MTIFGSGVRQRIRRLGGSLSIANGIFWTYFWISFRIVSTPYERKFCIDGCFDPYVLWHHAIGLGSNPLILPFMRTMIWVEFPSFCVATILQNLLTGEPVRRLLIGMFGDVGLSVFSGYPNQSGGVIFLGISVNGYRLLLTMLLSFLQWLVIAKCVSILIQIGGRRLDPNRGKQQS
jgi:hypothetical protein